MSHFQEPQSTDAEMPFLSHLIELRDRLLRAVLTILVLFLCLFPFANDIYTLLAAPLMSHLPAGASMIATEVASPFLTPIKLTLVLAFYLAIPVLLYHFWGFVAPGLYAHEKNLILPLLVSSSLLFYAGMLFAYFLVFPLVFGFFVSVLPQGIEMATDITHYLDFVLNMFFAFGLAFEVPIFTILLIWTGFVTPQALAEKRPYIIVGVFIIAMVLTPPEVFSQVLLAVPMLLLFELGLWMSGYLLRYKTRVEQQQAAATTTSPATQTTPSDYQPLTAAELEAQMRQCEAEDRDQTAK